MPVEEAPVPEEEAPVPEKEAPVPEEETPVPMGQRRCTGNKYSESFRNLCACGNAVAHVINTVNPLELMRVRQRCCTRN